MRSVFRTFRENEFISKLSSRADNLAKREWALRAAEKLILETKHQGLVTGHDFSHAENSHKMKKDLSVCVRTYIDVAAQRQELP